MPVTVSRGPSWVSMGFASERVTRSDSGERKGTASAPPSSVSSNGESIDTSTGDNPFRELEGSAEFDAHVWNGRRVYYENCYFCHGDELQADGHFGAALQPPPISFRDDTTIAMFTEAFLFWRVAKGGPGLPGAATPWDSAMPAWETFLTEEEMWDVVMFLTDFTEYTARARSEHSDGGH